MALIFFSGLLLLTARTVLTRPPTNDDMTVMCLCVAALVGFIAVHAWYFGRSSTRKEDTGLRVGGLSVTRDVTDHFDPGAMTPYRWTVYLFSIAVLLSHVYVFCALLQFVPWPMSWARSFDAESVVGL